MPALIIAVVEDNPGDARLIQIMLNEVAGQAVQVACLSSLREALDGVAQRPFDVVLLDLGLPDSQGLETFDRVNERAPATPIIVFSGAMDERMAAQAVARGAQDYLVKGEVDGSQLKRAINYACERKRCEIEKTVRRDAKVFSRPAQAAMHSV